ncbi:MAG TPA: hypothetical protein VEO01_10495, partial [Pseudonocardiaceae bacterium]|nr:hypothetical protein [Pseudonocardiaceae bacterium]
MPDVVGLPTTKVCGSVPTHTPASASASNSAPAPPAEDAVVDAEAPPPGGAGAMWPSPESSSGDGKWRSPRAGAGGLSRLAGVNVVIVVIGVKAGDVGCPLVVEVVGAPIVVALAPTERRGLSRLAGGVGLIGVDVVDVGCVYVGGLVVVPVVGMPARGVGTDASAPDGGDGAVGVWRVPNRSGPSHLSASVGVAGRTAARNPSSRSVPSGPVVAATVSA